MKYIDTADQAKLLRKVLKESFPGVKFSVRISRYSGGSSIRVNWKDGPTQAQVEAVGAVFEGSYFDGMIDYKGSKYAMLDGEKVSFLGDFVFFNREISDEVMAKAAAKVMDEWGSGFDSLSDWDQEKLVLKKAAKLSDWVKPEYSKTRARLDYAGDDLYGNTGSPGCGMGYPGWSAA